MGYSRAENLLFAAFIVLAVAFAVIAATYGLPSYYLLAGLLVLGALYLFIAYRYLNEDDDVTSKEDLDVTDRGIVFTDWLGRSRRIDWNALREIAFTRYEALFPDPWCGDHLEESLLLVGDDGDPVVIPFELGRKRGLIAVLRRRFHDFHADAAHEAVQSKEEGRWLLWQRGQGAPGRDGGTRAES